MSLSITPDMILDLAAPGGRRDETAIILTEEGWEMAPMIGGVGEHLAAFSAQDLDNQYAPEDEDDERLNTITRDDAAGLAARYTIPVETSLTDIDPSEYDDWADHIDWRIVTMPGESIDDAWAFDLSRAKYITQEYIEDLAYHQIWRTPGGTLVDRVVNHHRDTFTQWHVVDDEQALLARLIDEPSLIAAGSTDPLARSARALADLVDVISDDNTPGIVRIAAITAVGEAVRDDILPRIAAERSEVVRCLVADRGAKEVADLMGVTPSAVSHIIRRRR